MPEEIKQEVVLKTQKYLGKYVKKPPLSDKLLRKPPFRFLHDIINTVIKETGFLKGLFSDEELNSDNVKEKDAKIAFLTKLIEAVKTITDTDLAVRPTKIVAGLEPTETNLLLQTIGKAIEKKVDSSEYVTQLRSGQIINNEKIKKSKSKTSEKGDKLKKTSKTADNVEKIKLTPKAKNEKLPKSNETPQSTDRTKSKRTSKETKSKTGSDDTKTKPKDKTKKKEKAKQDQKPEINDKPVEHPQTAIDKNAQNTQPNIKESLEVPLSDVINSTRSTGDEETVKSASIDGKENATEGSAESETARKRSTSASRPKSARPRSGDLKEKRQEESQPVQSRPKSSLRPPSVRPSSARPGAPRLRPDSGFPLKEVVPMGKINVIVESFDKDADEEETVVIQSNPEIVEEQHDDIDVPGDNKGHLVEQILEQIHEGDGDKSLSSKIENDWQKDVFQGKDSTTKETNNLRGLIQTLTKTANPLGKLLNYLHEDIDAMHAELELWTNTKRQLFEEIAKQKKVSLEMNKPLISQLDHLIQEIRKMEEEIVSVRSNILKNELRIKELLAK